MGWRYDYKPYVPVAKRRVQPRRKSPSGSRRGRQSPLSSSRVEPSSRPSGARRGARTWRVTATLRTACRAGGRTSATARSWT